MIASWSDRLVFIPLIPPWILMTLAIAASVLVVFGLWRRARGIWLRGLGFLLLLLVLAGPNYRAQSFAPLQDIALVLSDHSASMAIGDRAAVTEAALAHLRKTLPAHTELREAPIGDPNGPATDLFASLRRAIGAIPPDRLAGIVLLTDGEATDAPIPQADLPRGVPVSALIPARGNETDRELRLLSAPSYGLVGQTITLRFVVHDHGVADHDAPVPVTISVDGKIRARLTAPVDEVQSVPIAVRHAGRSVVDVAAAPLPGAVSDMNDQAVFSFDGIRRRLNVLLIAGSPTQGLRSWRLLLKSDPSVRLANFTILRLPDEKLAAPPVDIALIPFPVVQLFALDLARFDLIVIDQFAANGLLPEFALENIANHVRSGGALLVEAGPSFDSEQSLAQTALDQVLPIAPIGGGTTIGPFTPALTPEGARHPVTAPLAGAEMGQWYRFENGTKRFGRTLLTAPGGAPLLVLGHAGKGRVAMLMTDQFWIWTRGTLGGDPALAGPAIPLLRRSVHWLLGAPDLAADRLTARIAGGELTITRRAVDGGPPGTASITAPDGTKRAIALERTGPGQYRASVVAKMPGVWRVDAAGMTEFAGVATGDQPEYRDLAANDRILRPIVEASGGERMWLGDDPKPAWSGLLDPRHAKVVTGARDVPLAPPIPLAALGVVLLGLAWWRER